MPAIITPWRAVAAAFALNGILLGCWASRIPAVVSDLELSESALGVLLLFMGVGALVSFPVAGRLSDHFGAVRVARWIAAACLLSIVLVGLSGTTALMAGALLFFGMCHGAMDVTMNSWASEVERHMARPVMSSFHAMWSLGAGLGAAGGYLATSTETGVALHFTLAALVTGAVFGPFLALRWSSVIRRSVRTGAVFALPRGPLIAVGVVALGSGLGEGAVTDWSAVFLRDALGADESRATLGFAVFSVTMVAMRLCAGPMIERLGPVTVARTGGIVAAAGYLLCVLTPAPWVGLAGFMLVGVGLAAVVPMAFSRAANDPEIPAGQAIASVATLGYGAMLLGPPAIGFIAHATSLRVAFLVVAICAALIAVLAGSLRAPGLGRD
ncbi:putative transporter y4wD [Salipiger pallidus]|uniref:Putative transporter y4wD n=1 Tax=Salipiger pallidus TaxID=1775170 RepID=A0A8J2ZMY8_9RHOB|nr:MFS transporter [Salipiger pallidus]GGG85398.1 putative transporter y4wD [Salipiger pallidus]